MDKEQDHSTDFTDGEEKDNLLDKPNSEKKYGSIKLNLEISNEEKPKFKTFLQKLGLFILNNYLPISLISFVIFGILIPQPGNFMNTKATKYACIALIFIHTGLYLRTKEVKEAITSYKAAIWGIISILGVTCVIGGGLTTLLNNSLMNFSQATNYTNNINYERSTVTTSLIGPTEFRFGLIVYMVMPCTITSGIVLVTQLKGHIALAVLYTVVTNVVGVFTIPLYLNWLIFQNVSIHLNIPALLLKLFLTVLLPIFVGKCIGSIQRVHDCVIIPRFKNTLKIINLTLLATFVSVEVSTTSYNGGLEKLSVVGFFFIVGWANLMHLIFMLINYIASIILKLQKDQQKCLVILASHKTMGIAASIITFLPESLGEHGFMVIAVVIGHLSILLFDSIFIQFWLFIEENDGKCIEKIKLKTSELKATYMALYKKK